MSFYNTTRETGETLREYITKALTQELRIYRIFLTDPRENLTPEEILVKYRGYFPELGDTPIISIRRACSNLKADGYIKEAGVKRLGDYGRPVNALKLPESVKKDAKLPEDFDPDFSYIVKHIPTGEDLVIIGVDKDKLSACCAGWPPSIVEVEDCINWEKAIELIPSELFYRRLEFGHCWQISDKKREEVEKWEADKRLLKSLEQ